MEKHDILEYMTTHRKVDEICFRKKFPEAYSDMRAAGFPDGFAFRQRLYHWIYDDFGLKLGVCPVCGKRCSFESFNAGYKKHCSRGCSTKSADTKSKRRRTCLKKYGYEHESKNEIVKKKKRETCMKNHGTEYPQQSEEIRRKTEARNTSKYGVPYTCMLNNRGFSGESGPNRKFAKMLERAGVPFEREFFVENYYYDFKIGKYLVEINPTATHNSYTGFFGSSPKEKDYHYRKTAAAEKHGYMCVHIWDWTNKNAVIESVKNDTLYTAAGDGIKLHWYNVKTGNHFTGKHDARYMTENGYLPVYDDGKVLIYN